MKTARDRLQVQSCISSVFFILLLAPMNMHLPLFPC
jgi:hypothetical protein